MKLLIGNENCIKIAANFIKEGKIVGFPTETIYGIGCNIFDTKAVDTIFQIKGRDYNKPLLAHISDIKMVEMVSSLIPVLFYELANVFLPGPLTMIIPVSLNISPIVVSNNSTIGIRFPSNVTCKKLIDYVGHPIAGTSANISGEKEAINTNEISIEIKKKLSAIIDDGNCLLKKPSTIISLIGKTKLIREGAISIKEIEGKIGRKIFLD